MRPLAFLHGFLGSPDDWNGVIECLTQYRCIPLTYPFTPPAGAILIGYSMGGRIALGMRNPAIAISAHPGLTFSDQNPNMETWIDKLQTASFSEFLEAWYAQPLFETLRAHPQFPQIIRRRLSVDPQTALRQLQNHPLQPFSRAVPFLYGEYDLKYRNLYANFPSTCIKRSGHACHLENPKECAQAIRHLLEEDPQFH